MKTSMNRARRRQLDRNVPSVSGWKLPAAAAVTILFAIAVIAIVITNRNAVPKNATEAPLYASLEIGSAAPRFAVTSLDGKLLDSRTISKPILLEVFATWCPHCQHEVATLNALHRHLGDNLAIVAASGSDTASDRRSSESAADVAGFARYFGVTYPLAYDPELAVAKHYLQGGFPTIVFIDAAKRIVAVESGEIPLNRLTEDAKKAGAAGS